MSSTCFHDAELLRLLNGGAKAGEVARVEAHLLECLSCLRRADELCERDPLWPCLQSAGLAEDKHNHRAVESLLAQLRNRSQLSTAAVAGEATFAMSEPLQPDLADFFNRLTPAESPDEHGRLGPFRLLKLLGVGGMGMVFAAEDTGLGRQVALKTLRPQLLIDRTAVQRFLAEARAAATVRDPHVVTVHQVGEINGVPFFIQELLQGESLETRIAREPRLPIAEMIRIARELVAGLAAAHRRGLLHRDIKPGNIWLEDPGATVRLLDFGLARSVEGTGQLTASGMLVGTPAYMSPEQANGEPIDVRSDLFSVGVVLYLMTTGRRPFDGAGTLGLLRALATITPPSPCSLNRDVPNAFSKLIDELLEKDREQRPPNASQVAERLARIASPVETATERKPESPARHHRKAVLVAVGGLLVAALATLALRRPTEGEVLASRVIPAAAPASPVVESVTIPVATAAVLSPAIAPFDAGEAARYQQAWADRLRLPVEVTNSLGMRLRLIPPGEFTRGSTAEFVAHEIAHAHPPTIAHWQPLLESETPAHRVVLSRPFYLGIHETTQEQFAELMQRNPSFHAPTGEGKNSVGDDTSRHPVETVTWVEAQQFCLTLSVREKLQGAVPEISHEYRGHGENYFLPTEAEWEFACRAGSESTYWFGPDLSEMPSYGWCAGISSGYTNEVGQLQANPFGLHDMYGNVYEWCFDWLDLTTYQRLDTLPVVDPRGPASTPDEHFRRVHRGGAFHEHPAYCRSALRHGSVAFASGNSIGFRVALSIDGARESLRHGHLSALSPGKASP